MIVVAKKKISVLQLFISRMPKMCTIPQLVSAPLTFAPSRNVLPMLYYKDGLEVINSRHTAHK